MASVEIFRNKRTDGVGTAQSNSGSAIAVYAISLKGNLDDAFVDVLIDLSGGSDFVVAGKLSAHNRTRLIMIPAGAKVNARLVGARASTNVTVILAS